MIDVNNAYLLISPFCVQRTLIDWSKQSNTKCINQLRTGLMPAQCKLQQLTKSFCRACRCAINDTMINNTMMTESTSQQESTNSGDHGAIGPRDSRAQSAAGFGVGYDINI